MTRLTPHRLQPRGSPDSARARFGTIGELCLTAGRPSGSHTSCLAGRSLDHVPGVPRRCLAARPRRRIHGARARRYVGGGVYVGAGRPSCRIPQPPERRVGPVDDGRPVMVPVSLISVLSLRQYSREKEACSSTAIEASLCLPEARSRAEHRRISRSARKSICGAILTSSILLPESVPTHHGRLPAHVATAMVPSHPASPCRDPAPTRRSNLLTRQRASA